MANRHGLEPVKSPLNLRANPSVYIYISVLSFLFLSPGNLVNTPLQFIYKNQLHLVASQTAIFKLIINLPGFFAFLFGICRDRFNPLKMGDRGFILIFGSLSAFVFIALSQVPLTVYTLGAGLILWGIALGMVGASYQAIMRNISEVRMMSGRMSTTYNLLGAGIPMLALYGGGWLAEKLDWRTLLLTIGFTYFALGLVALWKPKVVFHGLGDYGNQTFEQITRDLRLLARNRGFWIAVAMWGVWAFSPSGPTPLMYFLTDTLKMRPLQYSTFNAIFNGAALPTIMLFGVLCKKVSLWRLLLISTVIGIPQWLPVMFIHTPLQSYIVAALIGLGGGLASTAYYGLLFRACPESLAGTGMLVAGSIALIVIEVGNVLGGYIYSAWGFAGCAIVTSLAYCVLLPLCFALPRSLVQPVDNEHVPTLSEIVLAEEVAQEVPLI